MTKRDAELRDLSFLIPVMKEFPDLFPDEDFNA